MKNAAIKAKLEELQKLITETSTLIEQRLEVLDGIEDMSDEQVAEHDTLEELYNNLDTLDLDV